MPYVMIGDRRTMVTDKMFLTIQGKRQELAERDRRLCRELREARLIPSTHRNATFKVTSSNHATPDKVEISPRAAWLADKAKRLNQDFETYKVPVNLSRMNRMNEAFKTIATA